MVSKSTPAVAVESLEAMVLLTRFVTSASCSETPAPSQPARLLVMMLLVTCTEYQFFEVFGNRGTSVPLTLWRRRARPLPASAALPLIRLALITRSGTGAVAEARCAVVVGYAAAFNAEPIDGQLAVGGSAHHDDAAAVGGNRRVQALVEDDRVVLDVAVLDEPTCEKLPPSPVLMFPHIQL